MNIIPRSFVICVSLLLSAPLHADDSITIRLLGGYPVPGERAEWTTLQVARASQPPGTTPRQKKEADPLFEEVSTILTSAKIANRWQLVIPDAPAIEITIEIEGRKWQLTSCHIPLERNGKSLVTERGLVAVTGDARKALLARESETFRRHRAAFDRVLALTLERIQARLSPPTAGTEALERTP